MRQSALQVSGFLLIATLVVAKPDGKLHAEAAQLRTPETACNGGDFRSFLEANMRSSPFNKANVAPIVHVTRGTTRSVKTRVRYRELPITLMDNYFITSQSARGNPRNWETVRVDINESGDGRVRVDWVKIRFNRAIDEESTSPKAGVPYGPGGFLLFRPTTHCWQLTDDVVGR